MRRGEAPPPTARRCREVPAATTAVAPVAALDRILAEPPAAVPPVAWFYRAVAPFGRTWLRLGTVGVAAASPAGSWPRRRWGPRAGLVLFPTTSLRMTEAEARARVREERARMHDALEPAFCVHLSDAPFLLLDMGDRAVDAVLDAARERGVTLRDATAFRSLDSHVRVAVKRPRQNDLLGDL